MATEDAREPTVWAGAVGVNEARTIFCLRNDLNRLIEALRDAGVMQ